MNTQAAVRQQIRQFVMETLAKPKGVASLSDDDYLIQKGAIDSLGIFKLVAFLEETFSLRISDDEITPEHLQSISAIERLVLLKLEARSAPQ